MEPLATLIREEAQSILDERDWELMSARLTTNDDGRFQFSSLTDDGIKTVTFTDDVQQRIEQALSTLTEYRDVGTFDVSDRGATWVAGDENAVYVFETVSTTWTPSDAEFENIARRVTAEYDDIPPERVKTVDLSYSPRGTGFSDGTVVYETKTPHETIANVATFDEYIEWRAERNEHETESSLREQEYYEDHFHPTNSSEVIQLCEDVCTRITDAIHVDDPASATGVGVVIGRDGNATATVRIDAAVQVLEQDN